MDDNHTSKTTAEEALKFVSESTQILKEGNLHLHKWLSNSEEVMKRIPKENRAVLKNISVAMSTSVDEDEENGSASALGVQWNPKTDCLQFCGFEVLKESCIETKHSLASKIARLFDPLGLISPYVIKAKMVLQKVWIEGLDWSDPLPLELLKEWEEWKGELGLLATIQIPRCFIRFPNEVVEITLQAFGDASILAYATAIYIRIQHGNDKVDCHLVMSKSRVAPIDRVTLPRLELLAALLMANLSVHVADALKLPHSCIQCHSDSRTTLQWIRNNPSTWKMWVGNRVLQIQKKTDPYQWRHVPGVLNPSDKPSRGVSVSSMDDEWFHGPDFLRLPKENWPKESFGCQTDEASVEMKAVTLLTTGEETQAIGIQSLWKKFSDYWKIMRIICYMLRFARRKRQGSRQILMSEYREAILCCCRAAQEDVFLSDLTNLKDGIPLERSSKLKKYSAYYDEKLRVIRVGGRLQFSELPEGTKHQIILPGRHTWTDMLVLAYHELYAHTPKSWTLAHLRDKFWLVPGKRAVGEIINKCMPCKKQSAKHAEQKMGLLPDFRVTPSRPFSNVGVDLAGPLFVKSGDTTVKAWIVLYTCCVTRGVYLDLVKSMDTETFIQTMRRFTSHRGTPNVIVSDNAKTLIRTDKELVALFKSVKEKIQRIPGLEHIEWNFIPDYAPWQGGFWERLIGTVKRSLRRVLGNARLDEWEMYTVLAEVQSQVNSRPLCVVSEDMNDPSPVTPNKLLFGYDTRSLPCVIGADRKEDVKIGERWKHRQAVQRHFWNAWRKDYLLNLQTSQKWLDEKPNLKEGDLVLVHEKNVARSHWPMGIVDSIVPRRDGLVRTVKVREGMKTVKRPIQLLYPLEICAD
ncbi:MAG: hypothetical protein CEE38_23540 [Planctomycetes bacterium B3_Pla]|nr:MAG: hypothetical protein CEE38_23540 [Planctomycetes bacterium B3_Pla]